jgi:hypothetical protein
MFFSALIVLIVDCVIVHLLYSIQRNRRDWPCQVTNAMVMIFVVSKRSSRQLDPPTNEILFKARFELKDFSFLQNLFIGVNFNFVNLGLGFLRFLNSHLLLFATFLLLNRPPRTFYLLFYFLHNLFWRWLPFWRPHF